MAIGNIKGMLDVSILGVVPEDKNILAALRNKNAIISAYPRSRASVAYKLIAARIAGVDYKAPSFMDRFFG